MSDFDDLRLVVHELGQTLAEELVEKYIIESEDIDHPMVANQFVLKLSVLMRAFAVLQVAAEQIIELAKEGDEDTWKALMNSEKKKNKSMN